MQDLANGGVDEDGVPINRQHGRDADAAEIEVFLGVVGEVEELFDDLIGEAQELEEWFPVFTTDGFGAAMDGFFDGFTVAEDAQGDDGVDLGPDGVVFNEGEAAEGEPATGLAPDGDADYVLGSGEFVGVVFVVGPDEGGEFAAAFVFAAGLEFDDFGQIRAEEIAIQREVAKEIGFAVFHREDEGGAFDALDGEGEGAAVPHEIADAVSANGPGAGR